MKITHLTSSEEGGASKPEWKMPLFPPEEREAGNFACSTRQTLLTPLIAHSRAMEIPTTPAPMTTTSNSSSPSQLLAQLLLSCVGFITTTDTKQKTRGDKDDVVVQRGELLLFLSQK
jgi:hypothetical protein